LSLYNASNVGSSDFSISQSIAQDDQGLLNDQDEPEPAAEVKEIATEEESKTLSTKEKI